MWVKSIRDFCISGFGNYISGIVHWTILTISYELRKMDPNPGDSLDPPTAIASRFFWTERRNAYLGYRFERETTHRWKWPPRDAANDSTRKPFSDSSLRRPHRKCIRPHYDRAADVSNKVLAVVLSTINITAQQIYEQEKSVQISSNMAQIYEPC